MTEQAFTYQDGRLDAAGRDAIMRVQSIREATEAVASWTEAAYDHALTSYWGAAHVRAMRAYWLGVLREQRERRPYELACLRMRKRTLTGR